MKKYIVFIFFLLTQLTLFSQDDINGNFEEWYCYPPFVNPIGWTSSVFDIPCTNSELTANKTTDSYIGELAVEMTSSICIDPYGGDKLEAGFLFTAVAGSAPSPIEWSVPYTERHYFDQHLILDYYLNQNKLYNPDLNLILRF